MATKKSRKKSCPNCMGGELKRTVKEDSVHWKCKQCGWGYKNARRKTSGRVSLRRILKKLE